MNDELKPCPFCGSDNVHNTKSGKWWTTTCWNCSVSTEAYLDEVGPPKCWNNRPIEDNLRTELDGLKAALRTGSELNATTIDALGKAANEITNLRQALEEINKYIDARWSESVQGKHTAHIQLIASRALRGVPIDDLKGGE